MPTMTNAYNKKQAEIARRRRAMYYRLYVKGKPKGLTQEQLARQFKISQQRMAVMLKQAKEESKKKSAG